MADAAIRAIETRYNGYRFRSRLEARWAVFFDALGIRYEYEKEGYRLGSAGWYLPDFWLPKQKAWVEIKAEDPSDAEQDKIAELVHLGPVGTTGFIFYGPLFVPPGNDYPEAPAAHAFFGDPGGDWPYSWCECPDCGLLGIKFDGRSDRLPCKECYHCACVRVDGRGTCPIHGVNHSGGCPRNGGNLDKGYNLASDRLRAAYALAMSARFEHGEVG